MEDIPGETGLQLRLPRVCAQVGLQFAAWQPSDDLPLDFQFAPVLTQPESPLTLDRTLVPMVSGGLWPPLDLQPMAFSAYPVFSWIHFGGKPDLGSEQPAPFGRLQSQGQSSHTKPRGLRGAQVTLMNEMNSFQSQV